MLCFRYFLVAKKFMEEKGEGKYRIFPSKVFVSSTETFRRGTLLCCVSEIFLVAKKFMENKGGGASIETLPRKIFVSNYRNIS